MSYRPYLTHADRLVTAAVRAQRRGRPGYWLYHAMCVRGTDIPPEVTIGEGLHLKHAGIGVVVHSVTRIGRNVTIYHGVTIGRADVWREDPTYAGVIVEDDVILGAGAAVLASGPEPLIVRAGTVVGANAVLTRSTGEGEIWVGAPARQVGKR